MNEEEMQELQQLRAEKTARVQTERAAAALESAGAPRDFAPLLSGGDDTETDRRVAEFCTMYQSTLAADVKRRLPAQPPVLTPPAPPRPARGVRRLR